MMTLNHKVRGGVVCDKQRDSVGQDVPGCAGCANVMRRMRK
jgi:hypothetical protein